MTEKEYRIIIDNLGEYSVLRPDGSMVSTEIKNKARAELFCDELNRLLKGNEQLKSICQDHKDHAMDFKADCGRLEKENDELKKENNNLKKALWEAEENYLYEAYYDNSVRREDKLKDLKEDFKREYWND